MNSCSKDVRSVDAHVVLCHVLLYIRTNYLINVLIVGFSVLCCFLCL
jgi:hypothetical protein